MSSLLNTWVETIKDQVQSLAQIFQIGCRICDVPHFDGECEGHTMLGIGHLESQSNSYSPNQHQYQTLSLNPHSSYPVFEPQPNESSDLRDTPLTFLNTIFSPPFNPRGQMLRHNTDIINEQQANFQVDNRNQVRPNYSLQGDERNIHTTSNSLNTDLHSHEFGHIIPSPTQPSESSLPPILNLSSSETNEEFILEELSEPLQLETSSRSDEYNEVDEELEMENPEEDIFTEDSASERLEDRAPTLSSDLIPNQTDVVDTIPQLVVVDYIPHGLSDESPLDQPSTQVVNDNVVTRLETLMDSVPPPCPMYNIFIESKTIGSKVGFASWSPYKPTLHHIMTYTSRRSKDPIDQPILPIQLKEVIEVERFVIPPVKQFPHFEPSPHIGHTLALTCFKLLGMYQYYHLCLLMDARKPLGFHDK